MISSSDIIEEFSLFVLSLNEAAKKRREAIASGVVVHFFRQLHLVLYLTVEMQDFLNRSPTPTCLLRNTLSTNPFKLEFLRREIYCGFTQLENITTVVDYHI